MRVLARGAPTSLNQDQHCRPGARSDEARDHWRGARGPRRPEHLSHAAPLAHVRRDGVLKPVRFKPDVTLEQLQLFVDSDKQEVERIRRERVTP